MPNISKLSRYLKAANVKDGDTIKFMDAGSIVEKESQGKTRQALEMNVIYKGDTKIYSPNMQSQGLLAEKWGDETEEWVGKEAKLYVMPTPNGKDKTIIAKPAEKTVDPEYED